MGSRRSLGMRVGLVAAVVAAVVALWGSPATALIDTGTGSTYSSFLQFSGFDYAVGGTFTGRVIYSNASVVELLLCSKSEIAEINSMYDGVDDLCDSAEDILCEVHVRGSNGSAEVVDHSVLQDSLYYVLLGNCEDGFLYVESYYFEMVNPGGRQLDTAHYPLPVVLLLFAAIWVVGAVAWLVNWVRHRSQVIPLHRALSVVPLTKLVYLVVTGAYWTSYSSDGFPPSTGVLIVSFFSLLCYEASLVTCVVVIAKGWCIARRRLSVGDSVAIVSLVGGLWIGLLLDELLGGLSVAILVIVYLVIIWYTSRSVWALQMTLRHMRAPRTDPEAAPVFNKFLMMKNFLIMTSVYLVGSLVVTIVEVFAEHDEWAIVVLTQTLDVFYCFAVGWTFRLRPFNPHLRLADSDPDGDGDGGEGGFGRFVPDPDPWDENTPVTIAVPGASSSSASASGSASVDSDGAPRPAWKLGMPVLVREPDAGAAAGDDNA